MKHSIFQKNIYKKFIGTDSHIVVSASAGSGKTTTIEHMITLVPPRKDSIYLAFNNSIVDEMKERIESKDVSITTMHSFGWRAILSQTKYKAKLVRNKSSKFIDKTLKKAGITDDKLKAYYFMFFSSMLDLMRQNLIEDKEGTIELANRYEFLMSDDEAEMVISILKMMNRERFNFDFTDMIYRPIKDGINLPKFDFVFVDESQDLSKCQQAIITKIIKRKGRMIAVGDPAQAIYGFAGADYNSYLNLKDMFVNTIELPLSVNYRCGTDIVKEAQTVNDQILPYEKNHKGIVRSDGKIDEIIDSDWVLCRNVKALVLLNLYLLAKGIKSYIKGRDLGIGLIQIVTKSRKQRVDLFLKYYDDQILKEIVKMKKKGVRNPKNTEKIDKMNQRREIFKVLSKDLIFSKDLIKKLTDIFKDDGDGVVLSTIHKSKGLENGRIFFLLPDLIPNKFATQEWQLQQENNLKYVAITRAKRELAYIHSSEFKVVTKFLKEFEDEED